MSLEKYATVFKTNAKVSRLLVSHMQTLGELQDAIDSLIQEPNEKNAQNVDQIFGATSTSLEAISNSIVTLVNTLFSEDGTVETIDVIPTENGNLLS